MIKGTDENTSQFEIQKPMELALRKAFTQEVKLFSRLQSSRSLRALIFDWTMIVTAIALSEAWPHPLIYFASLLCIAGRQHGLFVLVHEAAHFRLFPQAKINTWISDLFAAYPVLFDTEVYRENHAKHHRHLNSQQDPDWVRKIPFRQWQFPMAKSFPALTAPKFLLWNGPKEWIQIGFLFCGILPLKNLTTAPQLRRLAKRAAYYGAIIAVASYFQVASGLIWYWMIPYLFVLPALQRVRSVAEHFGLPRTHELNSTRNVLTKNWFERALFSPHAVGLHLTHHLFPSVPFYNLQKLNDRLMSHPLYRLEAHQNTSYLWPSARPMANDLFKRDKNSNSEDTNTEKIAA